MFLFTSLSFLLDAQRTDGSRSDGGSGQTAFPEGQLSSAAWEGWWHEEAA
jgi:hypothetical protein